VSAEQQSSVKADFKVFHVRSSAGLYGAEYVILGLIPALAELGVDSTLLCLDNQYTARQSLHERALALGVPSERLPCRGRFDLATIAAIRRLLGAHPNSVLHVHDYKSALHAWLARGRKKIPIVATSHGQFSSTRNLHLYHRLELSLMRRFDLVCLVSDEMRPLLAKAGVRADRIRLIENGIDTRRFAPDVVPIPCADFDILDDAVVFGSAMRLTEQKNPIGLIEAFAVIAGELPQAMLAIVGDGNLRADLLWRAKQLGVAERVRIVAARADIERFYQMLDVFVLPSLYEGLPLALLEAMASGTRIVATGAGQVPRVLEGLPVAPVAPGDRGALVAAMRAAATRSQPAQALRERVLARYSAQRMARDYSGVYQELWSGHERAAA